MLLSYVKPIADHYTSDDNVQVLVRVLIHDANAPKNAKPPKKRIQMSQNAMEI